MSLEQQLREAPLPGEGAARERARRTVLAAHAAAPRRHRPRTAATAAAIVVALAGAGTLTRPGQAVGEWVGKRLEVVHEPAAPAPERRRTLVLPAPGRLLVASPGGLAIVDRDGHRTRLGAWTTGAWSPNALHLAVASDRTLAAIRPDGTVRWRFSAPARVADPRWSPNALNIAYRAGARMHLIWGTGRHDVALPGRAAAVAPAWRPRAASTVAWARADGTVLVQDAYTGKVLWRRRGGPVRHLSWSADGRRLLIAGRRHAAVFTLGGGVRRLKLAPGEELAAAAFAPVGGRLAVAIASAGVARVSLLGAKGALVEPAGRLRSLTWSPDGRWLLVGAAGGPLLARAHGGPTVLELPRVARPLDWSAP